MQQECVVCLACYTATYLADALLAVAGAVGEVGAEVVGDAHVQQLDGRRGRSVLRADELHEAALVARR